MILAVFFYDEILFFNIKVPLTFFFFNIKVPQLHVGKRGNLTRKGSKQKKIYTSNLRIVHGRETFGKAKDKPIVITCVKKKPIVIICCRLFFKST